MASPSPNEPPKVGLPPVQPPSGRFIVQLFVVPGIIILVVVLIVLGLSYLGKREREPAYFLGQLDSDNMEIRRRGMHELAQILKRSEPAALRWKTDAAFALDLAERLNTAFKDLVSQEKTIGEQIAKSTDPDKHLLWRKHLRSQRDHISFLASALGDFHVPVGAPLLCAILKHDKSDDVKGNTLQRRKALWSLMNMGENIKGFAKLPAPQRQQVLQVLKAEGASSFARAGWARTAIYYLDPALLPKDQQEDIVKVDETLVAAAKAEDRFLRALVAMAFNFWDGKDAEATLLMLTADTGGGTEIRVEEND